MTDAFMEKPNEFVEKGDQKITYINALTRKLFKYMLNELKDPIILAGKKFNYGDSLKMFDQSMFESLFNQWVTKCQNEGYMVIDPEESSKNTSERLSLIHICRCRRAI